MNRKADVIVVGGGVVGVSAAYFAASAGADVLIIEKGEIGSGATTASAGLIVPDMCFPFPNPENIRRGLRSLLDSESALRLWPRLDPGFMGWLFGFLKNGWSPRKLQQSVLTMIGLHQEAEIINQELAKIGGSCYQYKRNGLLNVYLTEQVFHHGLNDAEDLDKLGVRSLVYRSSAVRDLEPSLKPSVIGGILYPDDSQVEPVEFMKWLAEQCLARGVRLKSQTEVYGFRANARRVTSVETTAGEFVGEQIILAPGAWLGKLAKLLGGYIPMEGAKGYNLTFPRTEFTPTRPMILEDKYVAVSPYAEQLKLTSCLDLDGLDLTLSGPRLARISKFADLYLSGPGLPPPIEVRRGLRPCTMDGLPALGRLHPWSNVLVASGHDQKGLTLGPLAGLHLSQLLEGKSLGTLEKALNPRRF